MEQKYPKETWNTMLVNSFLVPDRKPRRQVFYIYIHGLAVTSVSYIFPFLFQCLFRWWRPSSPSQQTWHQLTRPITASWPTPSPYQPATLMDRVSTPSPCINRTTQLHSKCMEPKIWTIISQIILKAWILISLSMTTDKCLRVSRTWCMITPTVGWVTRVTVWYIMATSQWIIIIMNPAISLHILKWANKEMQLLAIILLNLSLRQALQLNADQDDQRRKSLPRVKTKRTCVKHVSSPWGRTRAFANIWSPIPVSGSIDVTCAVTHTHRSTILPNICWSIPERNLTPVSTVRLHTGRDIFLRIIWNAIRSITLVLQGHQKYDQIPLRSWEKC